MSSRARTLQLRILKAGGKSAKQVHLIQPEVVKASVHRKGRKRKGDLRGCRRGTRKLRSGSVDQGAPVRDPSVNRIDVHKSKMAFKAERNATVTAGRFRWSRSNGGIK